MPFSAVVLVVLSCALHAFWNLLLKKAKNKLAFTALFLGVTPLIFAPMFSLVLIHTPPLLGWICIFATGIVYAAYFIGLAQAYLVSDLSFAYPLSRGLGPALTVIWGMVFLGERPSVIGFVGIAFVLFGAFTLQWQPQTPF
ncbi:MAG: SMR family transporter, partial [Armatimonadota bacterium]